MQGMDIAGQTAFITGATSGIGKACAELFASRGVHVVIAGRRRDRLEALAHELEAKYRITATPLPLDVRDKTQVDAATRDIAMGIDLLLNTAGLALATDKIQDADPENWDTMIDTNIKGLLYVTKAILPSMVQRNCGHIFNIGSVAGRDCYIAGNVYAATKHAVRALSASLRLDLLGTKIRVSEIAPGAVETEFSIVRWNDKEKARQFYHDFEPLSAADIADTVLYCATRPLHMNISELVVYPQAQASVAHIHRQSAPRHP